MNKIAVIDIGTNTFHLLIAGEDGTHIHSERAAVKLGKGGINKDLITDDAYDRAIVCLKAFREKIDEHQIDRAYATATSAVRNAKNGEEFVRDIQKETGIKVIVISGDKEAEYIYEGVKAALDLGWNPNLIIDIGGGSVEFIIGNKNEIFWKKSFEIGAQRLLEQFHKNDPIAADEIQELQQHLFQNLAELGDAVKTFSPTCLVGSSGTFDTLAEMDSFYKNRNIIYTEAKEYSFALEDFQRMFKLITEKTREERLNIPGMVELRVDMIVVACCLIDYIIQRFHIEQIRVSSYALKEGVLQLALNGKV